MNIKINDKNGIILKTKNKYCTDDIVVSVDKNLIADIKVENDVLKINSNTASVSEAGVLKF